MNILFRSKILALALCVGIVANPINAIAEDIDIFVGGSAGTHNNPNVLIVLDNTANWSGNDQKFPDMKQGQAEVDAIQTVINSSSVNSDINVGVFEFVTEGNASADTGGKVRLAIKAMDTTNKAELTTAMTTAYNNITDPYEKRNANTRYGDLWKDIYNYFGGGSPHSTGGINSSSKVDATGYTTAYSQFKSPLSSSNSCAKNYIIFVSNPNASGPDNDSSSNLTALNTANGSTITQLSLPNFTTSTVAANTLIYKTSACYASQSACQTAEATNSAYTSVCPSTTTGTYDSCACASATDTTYPATSTLPACSSGMRYSVVGTSSSVSVGPIAGTPTTSTGTSASCYASSGAASSAASAGTEVGGMSCPSSTSTTASGTTTYTSYACTYSAGATTSAGAACGSTTTVVGPTAGSATTSTATSTGCFTGISTGGTKWNSSTDYGGMTCASNTSVVAGDVTTATTYACTYSGVYQGDGTGGCGSHTGKVTVTKTQTPTVTTTTVATNSRYVITQTSTPSVTTTTAGTGTTTLGNTLNCYASLGACSTSDYTATCASYSGGCACSATGATTTGSCPSGQSYSVVGTANTTVNTATGTTTLDTATYNMDEWARLLYQKGVAVSGGSNQTATTYTIDVYNAKPNATHTSLMLSAAKAGGGKYFNATNKSEIVNALTQIFAEITSVNSTFASASLPVNATNRSQNENQVYIGMFRPDATAKPRWFGNLKRYQFIMGSDGVTVALGDKNGTSAINDQTGFITDCASSYWTSDSGTYWTNYPVTPSPASLCTTSGYSVYSDQADGPTVEKGAAAEVLRKGNNPTSTDTTPTWAVNRTQYTTPSTSSTTLQALSSSSLATLSTTTKNWTLGQDTEDENSGALNTGNAGTMNTSTATALTETRASIHGDVVHSRPLPVNYGSSNLVVYYGSNDGNLRATDASTGKELWSFIPYEFTSRLDRLRTNSPLVNYPSVSTSLSPTPTAKDYFWDGSIGLLQNADNSKVWIYPTMRRGGRRVYSMDVSTSTSPSIKWMAGCPNLTDDSGCTSGMTGIGQTWSIPNLAPVKGYSTTDNVAIMGGGYSSCEDADSAAPSCSSPKGAAVYVLDAGSGSLIKTLSTTRSVPADVALVDMDGDGYADYGYVLDTGGSLYRISFVSRTVAADSSVSYTALSSASWTITKVAHTNASSEGRKFIFTPAVFSTSPSLGKVYVAMGTGDREHPLSTQYPYTTPVLNRFYVFLDDLSVSTDTNLDDTSVMNNYSTDVGCTAEQILPTSSKKGWFIDLNKYGTGEQVVTSPLIVAGMVTFSTNRPLVGSATSCSSPLGEARGYWLNLLNGSGTISCPDGTTNCTCGGSVSAVFTGGGLPPSPVIGTVPINGKLTTVVIGASQRSGGASSAVSPQKAKPTITPTRKRVYNYMKGDN